MSAASADRRRKFDLWIARAVIGVAALASLGAIVVSAIAPEFARQALTQARVAADGAKTPANAAAALKAQQGRDIAREITAAVDHAIAARARGEGAAREGEAMLRRAQAVSATRARLRTAEGDTFEGEIQDGLPQGAGLIRRASGGIAAGFYIDGQSAGAGATCARSDCVGAHYYGDFRHDQPTGFGVGVAADGGVFRGEFKDGLPNGYGEYVYPNGAVYRGGLLAGKRQGFGALILRDGAIEAGYWADNSVQIRGDWAPQPDAPAATTPGSP